LFSIKKWLKFKKKISLPEEHWKECFWDKRNVMIGQDLCEIRGHLWKPTKEGNQAICERCKKVQTLRFDGNEGP